MIILDVEQGSPEWLRARCVPTGSNFDKIMTGGLKASTQAEVYQNKLVGEWYTGEPEQMFVNDAMARGTELEPLGRSSYEFVTGNDVEEVGFVYMDERRLAGCSPDGLCGDKGVEIKCPLPSTHISYLLSGGLPAKYLGQVQGSMFITGLKQWDFTSYCPGFPPLIITVDADPKWQEAFKPLLEKFIDGMLAKREKIIEMVGAPGWMNDAD